MGLIQSVGMMACMAVLILVSGTAEAQTANQQTGAGSSALKGFDTEQPIDVEADRLEVNDKDGTAFLTGAVKVVQGTMTLTTTSLTIYFNRDKGGDTPEILRIDALEAVTVVSEDQTVTGDWGVYDVKKRLITLGGKVDLKSPDTTLSGSLLQINLVDGITTMDRAPIGSGGQTRVKGRFLAPPVKE